MRIDRTSQLHGFSPLGKIPESTASALKSNIMLMQKYYDNKQYEDANKLFGSIYNSILEQIRAGNIDSTHSQPFYDALASVDADLVSPSVEKFTTDVANLNNLIDTCA